MKYNKEIFIKKAKEVHGDKYDYSKVEYINANTKVCIVCPIHGEFWLRPFKHLQGNGCKKCNSYERANKFDIVEKLRKIYGDKYIYNKTSLNNKDKLGRICITCPKHGDFYVTPNNALRGHSCKKCSNERLSEEKKMNISDVQKRIDKVYGKNIFKIDENYGYINYHSKVRVFSLKNNIFFEVILANFLQGKSKYKNKILKKEKKDFLKIRKDNFIKKAKEGHGNKYDYSKIKYKNNRTKVCIICPKHGEFWQTPVKHLHGQGCSRCKTSSLEILVENKLKSKNIKYEEHKFFKWLKMNGPQHLDFYLPDYNIAIECQGEQHYTKNTEYGKDFKKTIDRDENKYKLLKEHNIKLLYFTKKKLYKEKIHEECTIFSINDLLKELEKEQ